tara:strand:+ start:2738 stop:3271 length:534 start_codon:yes stop_codon:yes gene_type:complete
MVNYIKVSREQVIKEQLISAIKLFFRESSLISTHTLASASYEILHDLYEKKSKGGFINLFPKDSQKEIHRLMKRPQNFFKHADRPDSGYIEFNKQHTSFILLLACKLYWNNIEDDVDEILLFMAYTINNYLSETLCDKDSLIHPKYKKIIIDVKKNFNITEITKETIQSCLEEVEKR